MSDFWPQLRIRSFELLSLSTGKAGVLAANGALMLLLANVLAVAEYGLLVTAIGAQIFTSRILMLGIEAGMIRLRTHCDLGDRSEEVLRAGLVVIRRHAALLLLATLPVIVILEQRSASHWPAGLLCFVLAASIGTSLVDYAYTRRLAKLEYRRAAMAQSITAMVRLAVTAAVLVLERSLIWLLAVYAGATLACGVGFAIAALPNSRTPVRNDTVHILIRYSVWQGWVNVMAAASMYQGTFLLQLLGQREAAGILGPATTVSIGFFTIYQVFYDYLISRMVRTEGLTALPRYIKSAFGAAGVLVVMCVPLIIAIGIVLPYFLKTELHGAIPAFYWLAASHLLLVFQSPIEVVCHCLLRPQLFALAWTIRVVLIAGAGVALAPTYGSLGAAIGQAAGGMLCLAIFGGLVATAYRARAVTTQPLPKVATCAE